jgi:hypothetical protein
MKGKGNRKVKGHCDAQIGDEKDKKEEAMSSSKRDARVKWVWCNGCDLEG